MLQNNGIEEHPLEEIQVYNFRTYPYRRGVLTENLEPPGHMSTGTQVTDNNNFMWFGGLGTSENIIFRH